MYDNMILECLKPGIEGNFRKVLRYFLVLQTHNFKLLYSKIQTSENHQCPILKGVHEANLLLKIGYMSRDMTKPTKWVCAQQRLGSAWASAQSDQSLRCLHEESLGPLLAIKRTAKTLIRLGGCPGWSESSLGAHSFCWFCHVAPRMLRCTLLLSLCKLEHYLLFK